MWFRWKMVLEVISRSLSSFNEVIQNFSTLPWFCSLSLIISLVDGEVWLHQYEKFFVFFWSVYMISQPLNLGEVLSYFHKHETPTSHQYVANSKKYTQNRSIMSNMCLRWHIFLIEVSMLHGCYLLMSNEFKGHRNL